MPSEEDNTPTYECFLSLNTVQPNSALGVRQESSGPLKTLLFSPESFSHSQSCFLPLKVVFGLSKLFSTPPELFYAPPELFSASLESFYASSVSFSPYQNCFQGLPSRFDSLRFRFSRLPSRFKRLPTCFLPLTLRFPLIPT